MIKYTPKRYNKSGLIISAIMFITSAVCLCFSSQGIGYRAVLQLICIAALTLGIQFTTRYVLSDFEYILTDEDEKNNFAVIRIQGKHRTTVCNISLETAVAVVPRISNSELSAAYGKIDRVFNFCVNLFPKSAYCYVFEFNEKRHVIIFEPDEIFLNQLKIQLNTD